MPSVLIEVRCSYAQEHQVAIMEAVHAALRHAFKIPPGDRNLRLVVYEPHRFACPPAQEKPISTHTSVSTPLPADVEA